MKIYRFQNQHTPDKIIQHLKNRTKSRAEAVLEGGISFSHFGRRIRLIKKRRMQHPLQRVFIGYLRETPEGTVLSGRFCYPLLSVLVFTVFEAYLLYGFIGMFLSTLTVGDKCIVSLIFLAMLSFPISLFITGITAFRKEEEDVLHFLKYEIFQGEAVSRV